MTHFTESNGGLKSSMIVPVWVSHENRPETKKLVYAMLDTQSDVSFILDSTQDALGVQGIPTKLHLSTVSANNQLIECARLGGLRVRGHDSTEYISLPPVFSRSIIPVNRDHIPTPETANKWPHLQRIAHSLMLINECEVGLLLGYNCSKALAPQEVILPDSEGPYAQKTALGWSVIGTIDSDQFLENDCDPIGISHRVLTYEVPPIIGDPLNVNKTNEAGRPVHFSCKTSIKEVITPQDVMNMMEIDFNELKSLNTYSHEDRKFLSILEDCIHQRSDKHYETNMRNIMRQSFLTTRIWHLVV